MASLYWTTGVDPNENQRMRTVSQILEWPILVATLWVVALWYLSTRDSQYQLQPIHDFLLWSLFIFETITLSLLADNPKRYLRSNWVNLLIILLGIPMLWGLRATAMPFDCCVFSPYAHSCCMSAVRFEKLLSRHTLGPTLAGTAIVIIMAGFMIAAIDPAIDSAADGIWWAWVTVTTVGYGDVVPVSELGRAFGGILILVGVGVFAMLTASFAALFISRSDEEETRELKDALGRIAQLEQQLQQMDSKLDQLLEQRLDHTSQTTHSSTK